MCDINPFDGFGLLSHKGDTPNDYPAPGAPGSTPGAPGAKDANGNPINNIPLPVPHPTLPAPYKPMIYTPQGVPTSSYMRPQMGTSPINGTRIGGVPLGSAPVSGTQVGSASMTPYQQGLTPGMINGALNRLDTGMGMASQSYNTLGQQAQRFQNEANNASNADYNPAIGAFQKATNANTMAVASALASQRGTSANPGLAARNIGVAGATAQQEAVGQMASLVAQYRTSQEENALKAFSAQGQMAGIYGQIAGQYANAALTNQGQILNAIAAQNAANVAMQSNVNTSNVAMQSNINNANVGMMSNLNNAAVGMQSNINASNVGMQSNINNAGVAMQSNLNNNNTAFANNFNTNQVAMQSNINNAGVSMYSNANTVNGAQNIAQIQAATGMYGMDLGYIRAVYGDQAAMYAAQLGLVSNNNNTNSNFLGGILGGVGAALPIIVGAAHGGQIPGPTQKFAKGGQVKGWQNVPKFANGGRIPDKKRKKNG